MIIQYLLQSSHSKDPWSSWLSWGCSWCFRYSLLNWILPKLNNLIIHEVFSLYLQDILDLLDLSEVDHNSGSCLQSDRFCLRFMKVKGRTLLSKALCIFIPNLPQTFARKSKHILTNQNQTRPGNLVDAMPPIQALGGKGVLLTELVMKALLGQPIGGGIYRSISDILPIQEE